MSIHNKLPTNWTDGMKIGRQHFIDSETAMYDAIHNSMAPGLTNYNYGILPSQDGTASLNVEVLRSQASNFLLKVTSCRALTSGGVMIYVHPEISPDLTIDGSLEPGKNIQKPEYYLLISADHSERVPFGNPSLDETPARHPFASPLYKLHVIESSELNLKQIGRNHLSIGRFMLKNDELVWDSSYIPPCNRSHVFATLKQNYNSVAQQFNSVQTATYNIIQKVLNKNQNSPLAFNIKYVCEKISYTVSTLFFDFRFKIIQQAPIELVNSMVLLANQFKLALDCLPEKEKEDLLTYFKEWIEISPGKFDEMLAAVIEVDYDHEDIKGTLEPCLEFMQITATLFERLDELELIGRRPDKNIFVREITGTQSSGPKKKGFSLLD